MQETKVLLSMNGNDFSWSSWMDQYHAIDEIDDIIKELETGSLPPIHILFAPTGPIQEVSLSSGWGDEFIELARRFDEEFEKAINKS